MDLFKEPAIFEVHIDVTLATSHYGEDVYYVRRIEERFSPLWGKAYKRTPENEVACVHFDYSAN